jgi:hypothetical protein
VLTFTHKITFLCYSYIMPRLFYKTENSPIRAVTKRLSARRGIEFRTVTESFTVKNAIHEDGCLLGCSAISLVEVYQRFRGPSCLHHQGDSSHFYQTTRRYNPEDSHLRTHRLENLKSYVT